jgi:caffeoyl-CoA O-methyltransferase
MLRTRTRRDLKHKIILALNCFFAACNNFSILPVAKKQFFPEDLRQYFLSVSLREPPVLRRLREETDRSERAGWEISPEQGQFLALLVQLMGARQMIEIGVFAGYSALWLALALPEDGRVIACEISEKYTSIARRYWKEAGVEHRIDLRMGPALDTLRGLLSDGQGGRFDFAFIDADKTNYDGYYECALELLRPGGLIAVDNVLWSGRVLDAQSTEPDTVAVRALNQKLLSDPRVSLSMVPIGDGLTLALKR